MITNNYTRGSEWRKWDLHIHTPKTLCSDYGGDTDDIWDKYIDELERLSVEKELKVVGINDYLFIDGYKKVLEYKKAGRLSNIDLILPVIEFRLKEFVGNKELGRLNYHIIFADESLLTVDQIDTHFLSNLRGKGNLDSHSPNSFTWGGIITRETLIDLGNHIIEDTLKNKRNGMNPIEVGFNNINFELSKIEEILGNKTEPNTFLKEKYLKAIGKVEWSDFRWDGSPLEKKSVINGAHFVFSASPTYDQALKGKEFLIKEGVNNRLLHCSDAHRFAIDIKNTKPKELGHCYTWVKADCTFEGLKQILYEPNHRIKISEQKPREPIRKIESLKINFPSDTYIKKITLDKKVETNIDQEFCLNQLSSEIFFSHYFTCLIGGRGTGKSTIINLLGERLGEKTDFFKENNLIIDGKNYDIETDTNKLVAVSGTNEIEFVSQGKIERLAEGNELTKLIFNERIKKVESGFYDLDSEIDSIIIIIDETIKLLFDLQKTNLSLNEKNKEKGTTQNIIDSVNDDRYKEITNRINAIRIEINLINTSQTRYENLLNSIRILLIENIQVETQNDIESRINEILNLIKSIDEVVAQENEVSTKLKEFEVSKGRIVVLTKEFIVENQKLKEFFQEKGMSEETIKDSQKANENLARINSEIVQLTSKADRSKEILKENFTKIDSLSEFYGSYYKLIDTNLTQINQKLEINNENVLNINFKFEFNFENLKQIVFEEFYNTFSSFHISGTSANQVKEFLYLIEPNESLLKYDYKTFLEKLENEINLKGIKRANNYVKIVAAIFASDINFIVYQLILRKHLYNLSKFIKIKGYYGNRELQNCSFGQRCTAVIVTLLMTGVKPLVIDEPEAHLDNRLIADYLVDLIKSKKLDRQIIFATHNSNFVINGDSELIHILEIPLNDIFTNITSTSIENLENRENLLKLEGGKEAFKRREEKYGLK